MTISPILFAASGLVGALFLSFSACASESSKPIIEGEARVYDGDSIFMGRVEIRLNAIDAPEMAQACRFDDGTFWPCGVAGRDSLREMVNGKRVRCEIEGVDKYKRLLGICSVEGRDINAAMVQTGMASAYHYFSERYAPQEAQAKAEKIGIWQDAGFTEPYYCRHPQKGKRCWRWDDKKQTGIRNREPMVGASK